MGNENKRGWTIGRVMRVRWKRGYEEGKDDRIMGIWTGMGQMKLVEIKACNGEIWNWPK
jgi:hypothetical protein